MENAILAHPGVLDAAVIGVAHPKWQERPVALVVPRPGHTVTPADVHGVLEGSFARWQLPETVIIVHEIAKTSVGKIDKKLLREQYADIYSGVTTEQAGQ
nr:hypothetical protein [Acidiferrimicrobium sp. IK]